MLQISQATKMIVVPGIVVSNYGNYYKGAGKVKSLATSTVLTVIFIPEVEYSLLHILR